MQQNCDSAGKRHSIFRNSLFESQVVPLFLTHEPQIIERQSTKRISTQTQCPPTSTDSHNHSFNNRHRIFSRDKVGHRRQRSVTPFESIINRNSRERSRQKKHKIFSDYHIEKPRRSLPPERKSENYPYPGYRFTYNSIRTEPPQIFFQKRQLPQPKQQKIASKPIKYEVFRVIDVEDSIMTPEEFSNLIWQSRQSRQIQHRKKYLNNAARREPMGVTGRFN